MIIERLGEATPSLEEVLDMLGAVIEGDRIVLPSGSVRKTEHGMEVGVQHHYCRFDEGKWLPLKTVNAKTVP